MLEEKIYNFKKITSNDLNLIIANWNKYIKNELLLAPNTIKAYELDFFQFIMFLYERYDKKITFLYLCQHDKKYNFFIFCGGRATERRFF